MGNWRTFVRYMFILFLCASKPSCFHAQYEPFLDEETFTNDRSEVTELPSPNIRVLSSKLESEVPYTGENHKPEFRDCAKYKPSVKEEEELGKFVIQVTAYDIDPKESGGTISYSLLTSDVGRPPFVIDNVTGVITTNVNFDRDEPSYQKLKHVTVKATDNGQPILEDDCTFKVTIEDINDNSPVFDKSQYNEQVVEDLKVDREVMRVFAYDIDSGENARLTYSLQPLYSSSTSSTEYKEYFKIDANTGVIYLKRSLVERKGQLFRMQVIVRDNGNIPREAATDVHIQVVSSDKQPPSFVDFPTEPIYLKENFSDFEAHIVEMSARSNIDVPEVTFELIQGKTKQTNSDQKFRISQENTQAYITLGDYLDYETIPEYQLTVRVTNKYGLSLSKTIDIKVTDVNDVIPFFLESVTGSVFENEEPGAIVMQVRAIDKDGTSANNIVSYELLDGQDNFQVDSKTGEMTTLRKFDREEKDFYTVTVVAKDNSPSAVLKSFGPNKATKSFPIFIKDRNDNKPKFTKSVYVADNVYEDLDRKRVVIEVTASDADKYSIITYRIVKGNVGDAFDIVNTTGQILVNNKLDYETVKSYNLTVEANDGIYSDFALVVINIGNINDELPVFEPYEKDITLKEESTVDGCIQNMKAYDPDIEDRNADQKIIYLVAVAQQSFVSITNDGCVKLTKPLNRDKPNGFPTYQVYIEAIDNNHEPPAQIATTSFQIHLEDINDNAPFLNVTEVVWYENQNPGDIIQLTADDYDSIENGPPFFFEIAETATWEIREKFAVTNGILQAKVKFDREVQKFYRVPIAVTDSGTPSLTGISYMTVIIGDINDNEAKDGHSEIFVYNYNGVTPDVEIGRIYVEDPDDWDLPDKYFQWEDGIPNENFHLFSNNGSIGMKQGTPEGVYHLRFRVTEIMRGFLAEVKEHTVSANVTVTVKLIPEEAVRKSGSVRLYGATAEDFINRTPTLDSLSKKDILQNRLAKILNTSVENVDVFTVLTSPSNSSYVDVRFSAHGSPYYQPERLNAKLSQFQRDLEEDLGVQFVMININECLDESVCPLNTSCSNKLNIHEEPAVVFTNQTSFVGVQAIVDAVCECLLPDTLECLNGGTALDGGICSCLAGFEGPRCELLAVGFYGDGWAMYPPFESCNSLKIHLEILPQNENGLIFYIGPVTSYPVPIVRDFMSLELRDGYLLLLVNYGSGTTSLKMLNKKITDGASHTVHIKLEPEEILLYIDDCHRSDCMVWNAPSTKNQTLLNVNGPLQVGGTRDDLSELSTLLDWQESPSAKGFVGCVRNFTFNERTYNLGSPGESKNAHASCNYGVIGAATFRIDSNFLVAILVCIAILIILFLAVVVHRRKHDNWNEKDSDDICENIINYEDEGGGEVDTGFDMNVLRGEHLEDKLPLTEGLYRQEPPEVPDINGFLSGKKDICDRDPSNLPYDDVRHYAYEGLGNSDGSLSSLASCTDDGDLKFNYLSNFGPRFRKLADMYGEDPSDDGSQDGGEESWC